MTEQRELIFHDTIPLPVEELEKHRKKAVRQKDIILHFFRQHPDRNFTPHEVHANIEGDFMLITSVRRSITDLTKEGKLIKCDYDQRRDGVWKTTNRTWRYNKHYVAPLNPIKVKKMSSFSQFESKTKTTYIDIRH
jgi:hypothetical protein